MLKFIIRLRPPTCVATIMRTLCFWRKVLSRFFASVKCCLILALYRRTLTVEMDSLACSRRNIQVVIGYPQTLIQKKKLLPGFEPVTFQFWVKPSYARPPYPLYSSIGVDPGGWGDLSPPIFDQWGCSIQSSPTMLMPDHVIFTISLFYHIWSQNSKFSCASCAFLLIFIIFVDFRP